MKTHEIVQATIEAVSLVRKGANKRKFKILKSDGCFELTAMFKKSASSEKQIAFGEVYVPNEPDTHGDFMTAANIERMAADFLASGRGANIDTEHNEVMNGSVVVESFIARKGDPDFTPGAWVLGVHIPDVALWQAVKSGEITGFSMFGTGVREEREIAKSADPYKLDERQPDNGEAASGKRVSDRYPLGGSSDDLGWLVRKDHSLDALERDAVKRVSAGKAFQ